MEQERMWGKSKGSEKPEGAGGLGSGGAAGGDEAGGRSNLLVAVCATCGAQSYIGPEWKWFTCWKCGATSAEMVG